MATYFRNSCRLVSVFSNRIMDCFLRSGAVIASLAASFVRDAFTLQIVILTGLQPELLRPRPIIS